MKTVTLFLLLILSSNISASDSHWEALILEKMLASMTHKKEITIYSQDKHLEKIYQDMDRVRRTDDCEKADFVLAHVGVKTSCKKPEIVFHYGNYRANANAVGLFFWQKGRPTIRFSSKRLQQFGLQVKGELSKFVSSKN